MSNYSSNSTIILKKTLIEIRNSITLDKENWENILTTNCYAYALGLDIPESEICDYAYAPGQLSGSPLSVANHYLFKYNDLLECLYSDFNALSISFREVEPTETVSIDEWKIALFTSSIDYGGCGELLDDYHFLRQRNNGIWWHKSGWYNAPTNKDNKNQIIVNPQSCLLKGRKYQKSYILKLK